MVSVKLRYPTRGLKAAVICLLLVGYVWFDYSSITSINQSHWLDDNRYNRVNINRPMLDIMLVVKRNRKDRMGSRVQFPLTVLAIAHYYNWNFCAPLDPMLKALSFPVCNKTVLSSTQLSFTTPEEIMTNQQSRSYFVHDGLWNIIHMLEDASPASVWSSAVEEEWGRMVMQKPLSNSKMTVNEDEDEQLLWTNKDAIHIAVHVRRGDIRSATRNDVFISDDKAIVLIKISIEYLRMVRGNDVDFEVHLFLESYGQTNWTRYGDLVHSFHLAPEGTSNIDLNIRDWKHFVKADILLVGGTFSAIPALARPGPSKDGLPVTIFEKKKKDWGKGRHNWVQWGYVSGNEVIVTFPTMTISAVTRLSKAKHVALMAAISTVPNLLDGLCNDCKVAGFGRGVSCIGRMGRYVRDPYNATLVENAQIIVSGELQKQCAPCHPNACQHQVAKAQPLDAYVLTEKAASETDSAGRERG
jgi:hypothetical protein